ncbi:MAG: LysR family transcriptional regulator [Polyangiaceae bacterium]
MHSFGLDSTDCELLAAFAASGSLRATAMRLGRDASVISRSLSRVARIAPVVEKRRDRWVLTPLGVSLNRWTAEAVRTQGAVLGRPTSVRIGTTREFASRVVVPGWEELFATTEGAPVLRTFESGLEAALVASTIDVAFECGRPLDPDVAFRVGAKEPMVVCASPAFLRRHRVRSTKTILGTPYVSYERSPASVLLDLEREVPEIACVMNDIAAARAAVVRGLGWSILPAYAVREEKEKRAIVTLEDRVIPSERFGVWWLRGDRSAASWATRALAWLRTRDLG